MKCDLKQSLLAELSVVSVHVQSSLYGFISCRDPMIQAWPFVATRPFTSEGVSEVWRRHDIIKRIRLYEVIIRHGEASLSIKVTSVSG